MSLDRKLAAVPASAPKGRWSEYTQLSRQIKQPGLLDRRRSWYAARIGINLGLLAAGWVAFAVMGESWWQLATAAYLAIVFTQIAFVGHDAGHRQIFRSRRANDLVGLVHANLLVGISFDWWVGKHNRHHSNPNHEDLDPDISITALAFTADQASSKHGLVRLIARYQGWLFFPLLLLEGSPGGRGAACRVELVLGCSAGEDRRPANRPRRPAGQPERERLQARRLRAAELFAAGVGQAEVARQLGISAQAVSVWHRRCTAGGPQALPSQGRAARPAAVGCAARRRRAGPARRRSRERVRWGAVDR